MMNKRPYARIRRGLAGVAFAIAAFWALTVPAAIPPERRPPQNPDTLAGLNRILIPKLEFEDATVLQVLTFLKKQCQKIDPEHEGINLVIYQGNDKAVGTEPTVPEGKPFSDRLITLNMINVPLGEALRYVCLAADLQYRVEPGVIIIADKNTPFETMETRAYPVAAGVIDAKPTMKSEKWGHDDHVFK